MSKVECDRALARMTKGELIEYIERARETATAAVGVVIAADDIGYASGALNAVVATLGVPGTNREVGVQSEPHAYSGNRSQDTCWVGAPNICGRPIEDPIHSTDREDGSER